MNREFTYCDSSLLCILLYQNDSNAVLFFVSGKWSIQVCDAKEINRKSVDKNKIDRLIKEKLDASHS